MTWDIVDDKDHSGETWIDRFSEQMSSMNNITARLSERQFQAVVREALEIAFTNIDYDPDRGFKDIEIIDCLEQALVSFIKVD
jgi:hypothetical protein